MSSIVDVSIENVDNECFRPVLPLLWTPPASGAICIPKEAPTNFLQSGNIPVVKPSVPSLNPINVYLALQKQCSEKSSRRKVLADHSLSIEIGKCFWRECGWRFTEFKSAFVWRHACFTWWGLMYWNVRRRTLRETQIFVCRKCGWLFGVVTHWKSGRLVILRVYGFKKWRYEILVHIARKGPKLSTWSHAICEKQTVAHLVNS